MNRKQEMEKYLMPLLPEEPVEITATALQREYKNGYLDGQKKAYDECDEIARELSQIKTGCSKWLDKHDAKIREEAISEFANKLLCLVSNKCKFIVTEDCTYYAMEQEEIDKLIYETVEEMKEQESN